MNTTDNPKTDNVVFRLEPVEKNYLQQQATKCGLSLSNYCRQVLLGYSPKERLTKEQVEMLQGVRKLRNDLQHINNYEKRNPQWGHMINSCNGCILARCKCRQARMGKHLDEFCLHC